jgi:3'-phosphoadenosine 5'-phosphosulfate sulfotransferase (PAPS reductase)/FAD synthetase
MTDARQCKYFKSKEDSLEAGTLRVVKDISKNTSLFTITKVSSQSIWQYLERWALLICHLNYC